MGRYKFGLGQKINGKVGINRKNVGDGHCGGGGKENQV